MPRCWKLPVPLTTTRCLILSTGAFFDPKMERQYDLQLSNCRSPIHHSAIFAYSPRHSMQELDFHIIIHFVIFYPERWAVLHSIFFRTLRLPLITQHKHATIHQLTNFLGTPASKKPSYHGQCRCQCRYHHAYQNSLFLLSLDHFAYIMHVCLIIQDKYCKLPVWSKRIISACRFMQSWHLHVAVWKNVEWILSCRYCDIQILIRNFKYATSKLNKSGFGIAPPTRGNFRVNGGDQVIRIQSPTSEQSYFSHFQFADGVHSLYL